jgi:transposase
MMGQAQQLQPKLFYTDFSLERRISCDHPLRKIKQLIDFDFVRAEVGQLYGTVGNPSVDPAVILKLMFLLFYENVKSERALMSQLPLRLDWLWFCGYDLEDSTPNHSVISKARRRWGIDIFSEFFQRILEQCIDAGLVDGQVIHVDSSMIEANASKDKLQPQLRVVGKNLYQQLDKQAEDLPDSFQSDAAGDDSDAKLEQRVSPTDPDARLGKKYSKTTLGYKDHRVIDDRNGVITATITTTANTNDSKVLTQAVEQHELNTARKAEAAVADKGYGVIENYRYLHNRGSKACIPHQSRAHKKGKFSYEMFKYDRERDCYVCPAGRKLHKAHNGVSKGGYFYRCPRKICESCKYFRDCVSSKQHGRIVSRNVNAEHIEWADSCFSRAERHRLQGRRRYKAEGSFADATNNHGYKRARWRGLAKMTIQNLMIAAVQNLRKLLRYKLRPAVTNATAMASSCYFDILRLLGLVFRQGFGDLRLLPLHTENAHWQATDTKYCDQNSDWATRPLAHLS